MENIIVNATVTSKATVNILDAFYAIKQSLGLGDGYSDDLLIKDDCLVRIEDISYHGSPEYTYTEISDNPKWVELFQAVNLLEDYLINKDSDEWKK